MSDFRALFLGMAKAEPPELLSTSNIHALPPAIRTLLVFEAKGLGISAHSPGEGAEDAALMAELKIYRELGRLAEAEKRTGACKAGCTQPIASLTEFYESRLVAHRVETRVLGLLDSFPVLPGQSFLNPKDLHGFLTSKLGGKVSAANAVVDLLMAKFKGRTVETLDSLTLPPIKCTCKAARELKTRFPEEGAVAGVRGGPYSASVEAGLKKAFGAPLSELLSAETLGNLHSDHLRALEDAFEKEVDKAEVGKEDEMLAECILAAIREYFALLPSKRTTFLAHLKARFRSEVAAKAVFQLLASKTGQDSAVEGKIKGILPEEKPPEFYHPVIKAGASIDECRRVIDFLVSPRLLGELPVEARTVLLQAIAQMSPSVIDNIRNDIGYKRPLYTEWDSTESRTVAVQLQTLREQITLQGYPSPDVRLEEERLKIRLQMTELAEKLRWIVKAVRMSRGPKEPWVWGLPTVMGKHLRYVLGAAPTQAVLALLRITDASSGAEKWAGMVAEARTRVETTNGHQTQYPPPQVQTATPLFPAVPTPAPLQAGPSFPTAASLQAPKSLESILLGRIESSVRASNGTEVPERPRQEPLLCTPPDPAMSRTAILVAPPLFPPSSSKREEAKEEGEEWIRDAINATFKFNRILGLASRDQGLLSSSLEWCTSGGADRQIAGRFLPLSELRLKDDAHWETFELVAEIDFRSAEERDPTSRQTERARETLLETRRKRRAAVVAEKLRFLLSHLPWGNSKMNKREVETSREALSVAERSLEVLLSPVAVQIVLNLLADGLRDSEPKRRSSSRRRSPSPKRRRETPPRRPPSSMETANSIPETEEEKVEKIKALLGSMTQLPQPLPRAPVTDQMRATIDLLQARFTPEELRTIADLLLSL